MYALNDIDVLALESGISAPFCTRILGDLGANVIKIERPGVGDVNRHWDTAVRGNSSAHVWVNRNKKSVELDLKSEDGNTICRELAEKADVVVQNFSPGVVESLGLDYESLREENEDLIYLNISGYGRDGPYENRKAYDMVMQGETGLIMMNGSPDAPAKIPLSICDINAAMYGTIGTLTALFQRERTGEGQELDVTMFGGMLSWLGYFPLKYWYNDEIPDRVGMRHHLLTPYGPHETNDGQYINFAVLSEPHFELFCEEVIDQPDLLEDERFATNEKRIQHRETFESIVEDEIATESRDHWAARLEAVGIPWGDVNQIDEVLDHPQTDYLEMVRELDTEAGSVKFIDNPLDMNKAELRREKMPDLGEDTKAVLQTIGYSQEQIESLEDIGVI
ncbi:Crotonobetainyl-CoA:carnitine CoA-transferase CaiB [Haladaptatus litoreus]|uniref:Crotonobetainyl-CoA:carnitine CoA-transferase CaiB n=1 Tax=Haladaptatus litoreus TaxID=553468 RepID=A0A1N7F1K0_9EURY|nr:CaiB/BaiF CoA-transferase family protein [Haladaptatus litoreus]SIR94092.1 Crotonobetainyl-CoA:carnitine CoA-transferase CaiB [Haladaptatus litoreus]